MPVVTAKYRVHSKEGNVDLASVIRYNFLGFLDEMMSETLVNIDTNPFFWGEQEFIVLLSPNSL